MRNFTAGLLAFTLTFFCTFLLQAQQDYTLMLKTGHEVLPENVNEIMLNPNVQADNLFEGRVYLLLQFHEIPNQAALDQIAASGIRLLKYVPNFTYIASLPAQFDMTILPGFRVRNVSALAPSAKLDKSLRQHPLPSWAVNGEYIEVNLMYPSDIDPVVIESYFNTVQVPVLYSSPNYHYITLNVEIESLNDLAALPFVMYVEAISSPPVPDDRRGQSLQRSNAINTAYQSTRKFDGTGVTVLVRDDGLVGPHIDFTGRLSNQTGSNTGNHADGVAGIFCGAGNLNPIMQGMAPGAELIVINYVASFVDNTLFLHNTRDVMITNSSYSDGCNNGYTSRAATVDRQMWDNPSLMHVFSAGNDNGIQDCGYGAGTQFGNITGGHKVGKNVVTVANVDAGDILAASSSRGPAADGRVKPDIAANGRFQRSTDEGNTYMSFSGTSAAAPSLAGVATQLYHAYKAMHGDQNPTSALIKTLLLNTADDLGNKGPDYFYGWGRVNAYKAYNAMEEGRYLLDTVTQGITNTHAITVPANTRLMKVMTYWAETPSFAGASKALINDLNTTITDPSTQTHGSWLLSSAPNAALLAAPATVGVDDLNNMEQVSIDNPAAGTYTLNVNGFSTPSGQVAYYVTYEFIKDEIFVSYPLGGEGFTPSEVERIRWDAPADTSSFLLEYSIDNGSTWTLISSTVPSSARQLDWTVPNSVSGEALIRISNGSISDVSDANFSIIEKPDISIHRICQAFTTVSWTPVPGATGYDVFLLGEKYMDSVGSTAEDTFSVYGVDHTATNWFAVRAKGPNGIRGRRTIAIPSGPGLDNCVPLAVDPAFDAQAQICEMEVVDFMDQSQNFPQTWQWIINPNTGTEFRYVTGTSNVSQNPRVQFLKAGTYNVIMVVSNEAGTKTVSKQIVVDPGPVPDFTHLITGPTVAFTNNSSNGTSYLWDFGDGTTDTTANPSHTYAATGSYQVKLVTYSICGADSVIRTIQAWPTAIGDLFESITLDIYPNPGKGFFTLDIEGADPGRYDMEVVDLQGKLLKSFSVSLNGSAAHQTLDLTGVSKGIYFLKVTKGESSGTVKLMVK